MPRSAKVTQKVISGEVQWCNTVREYRERQTNENFLDREKGTLQAHYQNHFWHPVSAISCQVKTAAFIPLYLTQPQEIWATNASLNAIQKWHVNVPSQVQKAYLAKYRWFFCNTALKREANICPPGSALVKRHKKVPGEVAVGVGRWRRMKNSCLNGTIIIRYSYTKAP